MAAVKVCRMAWSVGTAMALGMIVTGSALAGVWSPSPDSPQMVGIYLGPRNITGLTLVVVEGQTLKLTGVSRDTDTLREGTNTYAITASGDVIWNATNGGSVNSPPRKASGLDATITPPDVPQDRPYITFTVTAQADDWRTEDDPPGSLAPHTGNRNDAYGTSQTLTIVVVKQCPSTVSVADSCTDPTDWTAYWNAHPSYRLYGFTVYQMAVSGATPPDPPGNWNGLVITEQVILHPTDPGTATDADFENIVREQVCQGSGQFVVGTAAARVGDCLAPAADNAFWDFNGVVPDERTCFKEGLPTKTVNCRQVFKCKDGTNLSPAFKITASFSNVTVGGVRRNQVAHSRTTD